MYLYGTFKLLTKAVDSSSDWLNWLMFALYALVSAGIGAITFQTGSDAQYYLIDAKSEWADSLLYPSLFYLINWIEHTPRNFE